MERIYGVDIDKKLLENFGKAASKILAEAERRNLGKDIYLQYQRALSQECEDTHKGTLELHLILQWICVKQQASTTHI